MPDRVTLTLEEFAKIEGVPGRDTLRRLIRDNPDFPASVGKNGVAYAVDVEAGIRWLQEREARRAAEEAERSEAARELALGLLGEASATNLATSNSAAERKAILEEEFYAIKVAEKRRELIRKADVEAAIADVIVADVRQRATFMARLARRVELTREQIVAGEAIMDADRKKFAAALENLTAEDAQEGGGDG